MVIDTVLLWILVATLAGGVLSLLAAGLLSFALLSRWLAPMVSYAAGVLLAAAFLHLLPEAFSQADSIEGLFAVTLAGLLGFFLLEKAALWRHGHDHVGERSGHHSPTGMLIVVGDGFHNFVDGVLIAAAFMTDIALGVATTLAIIAHEIPQEVGDFMVLLNAGYSRKKALLLNFASSLMAIAGGVLGYLALDGAREATPYVLVLAAASFIYIAVADLIPEMHRRSDMRSSMLQIVFIAAGIGTILLSHLFLHSH
ncbi:MAG: ZIP family metal transporter [Burkholderiales bacterium]|nr:ZIP family metal transporter [Burkholderiales bacterium]